MGFCKAFSFLRLFFVLLLVHCNLTSFAWFTLSVVSMGGSLGKDYCLYRWQLVIQVRPQVRIRTGVSNPVWGQNIQIDFLPCSILNETNTVNREGAIPIVNLRICCIVSTSLFFGMGIFVYLLIDVIPMCCLDQMIHLYYNIRGQFTFERRVNLCPTWFGQIVLTDQFAPIMRSIFFSWSSTRCLRTEISESSSISPSRSHMGPLSRWLVTNTVHFQYDNSI